MGELGQFRDCVHPMIKRSTSTMKEAEERQEMIDDRIQFLQDKLQEAVVKRLRRKRKRIMKSASFQRRRSVFTGGQPLGGGRRRLEGIERLLFEQRRIES